MDGNCIICKVTVSVAGIIKKVSISKMYINVHIKLCHLCLDFLTDDQWAHTELHFQACLQKIIEVLNRAKLKWQPIHPIILLYGCLSSHSTCRKSLTEDVAVLPTSLHALQIAPW